jgi:hypothetical protein
LSLMMKMLMDPIVMRHREGVEAARVSLVL